jgi:hypothetical protein
MTFEHFLRRHYPVQVRRSVANETTLSAGLAPAPCLYSIASYYSIGQICPTVILTILIVRVNANFYGNRPLNLPLFYQALPSGWVVNRNH